MSPKFAPPLREREPLKTERFGRLFEVEAAKISTTPARESDSEIKIVKNLEVRSAFWSWAPQNLHHACVWERFGSQNRYSATVLDHFLMFKVLFAWQAQGFGHVAKCLAGAGVCEGCKNVNRRGGFEEGPKWCFSRGRPSDFGVVCNVDVSRLGRWMEGLQIPCHGNLDHFAWQLQEFVCLGSTFSWRAQYSWSIHLTIAKTYWNSEVKCLVNMSFSKEVLQKSFVFELQSFIFGGSLAEKLHFGASFLKEVSQKSFISELQSFNFEGSLAEKLLCCWHVHVSPAWHLTLADRFLVAVLRCVSKPRSLLVS